MAVHLTTTLNGRLSAVLQRGSLVDSNLTGTRAEEFGRQSHLRRPTEPMVKTDEIDAAGIR